MKNSRRHIAIPSLAVAAALALAGCQSGGDPQQNGDDSDGSGSESSTLDLIYQYSNDANRAGVEAVLDAYKEENPNVTLEVQALPLDRFYEVLQTRVGAGDLPDVAITTPATVAQYAAQGVLADIEPYVSDAFLENVPEGRSIVDRPGGMLVGAPISNSMRAVAYNKTALDEVGITAPGVGEEPWTWDEMVDAARAVQEAGEVRYGLAFEKPSFDGWLPFLYQNGGSLLDSNGDVAIDNEAGVGAIQWTVDLHEEGLAAPGMLEGTDDALRLFASGDVGIWLNTGPWMVASLEEQVVDFEYSFTFCPQNVNNTSIIGGSDVIAFANGNEETAAGFIEFATSPENITLQTNATGGLPARTDAQNVEFVREDLIEFFNEQSEYMLPKITEDYLSPWYGSVKDPLLRELQSAVIGERTAQEAASNMASIIEDSMGS